MKNKVEWVVMSIVLLWVILGAVLSICNREREMSQSYQQGYTDGRSYQRRVTEPIPAVSKSSSPVSGVSENLSAHYSFSKDSRKLPDTKYTPGKAALTNTKQVCGTLWGKDERHVTQKMKEQVCTLYGAAHCPGKDWEIDHLISRELGGADDISNLWPQPAPEYHQKDVIENALHCAVCAQKITLDYAQRCLSKDWTLCKINP